MATQAERNARLDALATAVGQWADKRTEELHKQVERNKAILKGRTGSERLTNASVQASEALIVDEINQFLTG